MITVALSRSSKFTNQPQDKERKRCASLPREESGFTRNPNCIERTCHMYQQEDFDFVIKALIALHAEPEYVVT